MKGKTMREKLPRTFVNRSKGLFRKSLTIPLEGCDREMLLLMMMTRLAKVAWILQEPTGVDDHFCAGR
jgi:hypothetical protein